MLAFRSVVSVVVRFVVRSFSTPSRSHPPSRSVTAVNKISADINQSLNIEFRFRPGTLHIKHGATLTFREGPPQPPFAFPEGVDPHTLSIVRRADLPQTLRELVDCEAGLCGEFRQAHDLEGASPNFVVNVGKAGPTAPLGAPRAPTPTE
jgi:hypothetical protein